MGENLSYCHIGYDVTMTESAKPPGAPGVAPASLAWWFRRRVPLGPWRQLPFRDGPKQRAYIEGWHDRGEPSKMPNLIGPESELERLGRRLRHQDDMSIDRGPSHGTAFPLYVIQQKVRHYGIDPSHTDPDGYELYRDEWDDGCGVDLTAAEGRLNWSELSHGIKAIPYVDRWEFVEGAVALTREGIERYLDRDRHNLREPRIYIASMHRSPEMVELLAALASLRHDPGAGHDLILQVMVWPEENCWLASGLELNYMTQGTDVDDAIRSYRVGLLATAKQIAASPTASLGQSLFWTRESQDRYWMGEYRDLLKTAALATTSRTEPIELEGLPFTHIRYLIVESLPEE